MYDITIIGSCISRDIFNSRFVAGYADHFYVDSYFCRTTMPSIVSFPVDYDIDILERDFNALYFDYNYTECSKRMLATLTNNQSEFILMDFYSDAWYGTYIYDMGYLRGSLFKLKQSEAIDTSKLGTLYTYKNKPEEYYKIWCKAFDLFMDYAKEHFPNSKIIINGILGSNKITKDGKLIKIQQPQVDIQKLNGFWHRLNKYAEEQWNLPVICYEKEYTLNPDYIYGLKTEFVHFYNDYYQDAFKKLILFCNETSSSKQAAIISQQNLIRNSDFNQGTKFWSFSNSVWNVKTINSRNVLVPTGLSSGQWKWIWCDPVEIPGDGNTYYTLSFSFIFSEEIMPNSELPLFGVRVFQKAVEKSFKQCIQWEIVNIPTEKIVKDKECRFSYTFKPRKNGRFIRIAPHIKSNICKIGFFQIQLQKGEQSTKYRTAETESLKYLKNIENMSGGTYD